MADLGIIFLRRLYLIHRLYCGKYSMPFRLFWATPYTNDCFKISIMCFACNILLTTNNYQLGHSLGIQFLRTILTVLIRTCDRNKIDETLRFFVTFFCYQNGIRFVTL